MTRSSLTVSEPDASRRVPDLSVVRGRDQRVYLVPGGGFEMWFPYQIPPELLEVLE